MKGQISIGPSADYEPMCEWCRMFPELPQALCKKAIPYGLMQHELPLSEHIKAITFCEKGFLNELEKICY